MSSNLAHCFSFQILLINYFYFFRGTLFNLLVILISEPQIPKSCPVFDIQLVADSTLAEKSFDAEVR